MLSENQEHHGDQLVSISKETMLEMMRRLSGFQNIDLVLKEKDSEIKQLRHTVSLLQSRLLELQEAMSGVEHHQSTAVNTDFQPSSGIHHRSSAPEIFVYPNVKSGENSFNESTVLHARGSRVTQRDNVKASQESRKPQAIQEQQKFNNIETNNESHGTSLRMDHGIGVVTGHKCESMGGVSEQYFNNVVSELVKTKQCLHNLQKQGHNKVTPHVQQGNTEALVALQLELRDLRQQHEQLQRENVLLKSERKGTSNTRKGLNDSFELEQKQTDEKTTQTDADRKLQLISPEVQQLKSEITRLTREKTELLKEKESYPVELDSLLREIDGLNKQIEQKTILYTQQRDSNKILSTCLQEEKERYKKLEDGYRENRKENRTLVDRLAHIRQKYEELRQEKVALEKSQSLLSGSFGLNPAHSLSSNTSNTSQGRHSRQHSNASAASTGSDYATVPARIQPDSGSYQEYECPQCLQTYSIEKEYQIHIAKCLC